MKSNVAGMSPEPLQSGVTYRLLVTAGSAKGQHDFEIVVCTPNPSVIPIADGSRSGHKFKGRDVVGRPVVRR